MKKREVVQGSVGVPGGVAGEGRGRVIGPSMQDRRERKF